MSQTADSRAPAGLAAENLACIRGERVVFAGLDLVLAPGRALLLAGPNGSGKSSLLRVLAGLIAPAAGRLAWNGASAGEDREAWRGRVAYVGHADPVKPALSVAENLAFWLAVTGGGRAAPAERIAQALDRFAIAGLADLPARHLSAGQRRRLTLARLAGQQPPPEGPALWLLDEPATGLDRAAVALLAETVVAHLAAGGLAVIASHGGDLDSALAAYADRFDIAAHAVPHGDGADAGHVWRS